MESSDKVDQLFGQIKEYVDTNYEIVKLKTVYHTSETAGKFAHGMSWIFCAAFFSIFFSIALALFLGDAFNNFASGFLVVGVLYLVAGVLFYNNKTWIKKFVSGAVIKSMLKQEQWSK